MREQYQQCQLCSLQIYPVQNEPSFMSCFKSSKERANGLVGINTESNKIVIMDAQLILIMERQNQLFRLVKRFVGGYFQLINILYSDQFDQSCSAFQAVKHKQVSLNQFGQLISNFEIDPNQICSEDLERYMQRVSSLANFYTPIAMKHKNQSFLQLKQCANNMDYPSAQKQLNLFIRNSLIQLQQIFKFNSLNLVKKKTSYTTFVRRQSIKKMSRVHNFRSNTKIRFEEKVQFRKPSVILIEEECENKNSLAGQTTNIEADNVEVKRDKRVRSKKTRQRLRSGTSHRKQNSVASRSKTEHSITEFGQSQRSELKSSRKWSITKLKAMPFSWKMSSVGGALKCKSQIEACFREDGRKLVLKPISVIKLSFL